MAKAEQFYDAAIAIAEETGGLSDAEVTLLVLAGIAAADVICCGRLGVYAHGESHQEAVALLRRAAPGSAKHLNTLLGSKTKAEYSHLGVSEADRKKAERAAAALLETARAT